MAWVSQVYAFVKTHPILHLIFMHFIVFKLNLNIVDIHVEFLKVCQPVWSLGREIPSLSQLGIGLATVNDLPPEGSSSAPPGGVPTAQIWLSL